MTTMFELYKPRKIDFFNLIKIGDWKIKVYTITNREKFKSNKVLRKCISELPNWLKIADESKLPVYNAAFLIVHEAREGIWILLNWWTGGEMIQTVVYFADFNSPDLIVASPYNNSLVCIWELEVITFERIAWINNILLEAKKPKFEDYLNTNLEK